MLVVIPTKRVVDRQGLFLAGYLRFIWICSRPIPSTEPGATVKWGNSAGIGLAISSQICSKGEGFDKLQDEHCSTESVVLLPIIIIIIASEMYFFAGRSGTSYSSHPSFSSSCSCSTGPCAKAIAAPTSFTLFLQSDGSYRGRWDRERARAQLKKRHLTCPYWIPLTCPYWILVLIGPLLRRFPTE
jgi:hypothetical protein